MAFANSATMVLFPLILLLLMMTTAVGLCDSECECDSSRPLVGDADCASREIMLHAGCEFQYSDMLEMMRQGDFESSSNRTTSCGMMLHEESDDSNSMRISIPEIETEPTQVTMMSLDVSDAPGSFPAELLVPLIIFTIFIFFGVSLVTYVIIPLIIITVLFCLYNP